MLSKRSTIMVVLIVAIVVLSAAVIYLNVNTRALKGPHFRGKPFMERMGKRNKPFFEGMQLTDEQKKLLEQNKDQHKEKAKILFGEIHKNMLLMRQELQKDNLDMEKVEQIQSEIKKIQLQILDDRLQGILEVRKILTPEQFREFSAKFEKRVGHKMNKFHGQMPMPPEDGNE